MVPLNLILGIQFDAQLRMYGHMTLAMLHEIYLHEWKQRKDPVCVHWGLEDGGDQGSGFSVHIVAPTARMRRCLV